MVGTTYHNLPRHLVGFGKTCPIYPGTGRSYQTQDWKQAHQHIFPITQGLPTPCWINCVQHKWIEGKHRLISEMLTKPYKPLYTRENESSSSNPIHIVHYRRNKTMEKVQQFCGNWGWLSESVPYPFIWRVHPYRRDIYTEAFYIPRRISWPFVVIFPLWIDWWFINNTLYPRNLQYLERPKINYIPDVWPNPFLVLILWRVIKTWNWHRQSTFNTRCLQNVKRRQTCVIRLVG